MTDTDRLEKLATLMALVYGRHEAGAWAFPQCVVSSDRNECTADHLRAAIDSMDDDQE